HGTRAAVRAVPRGAGDAALRRARDPGARVRSWAPLGVARPPRVRFDPAAAGVRGDLRADGGAPAVAGARMNHRTRIRIHRSMPDRLGLPIDDLMAAHERVLRDEGRGALEYGGSQGDEGLREWLASDYGSRESEPVDARSLVLTSGASGGLRDL